MHDNKDRHLIAHDKPLVMEMRLIHPGLNRSTYSGVRALTKKQNKKVVMCCRKTKKPLRTFKSIVQASDETGIGSTCISKVARGTQNTAGGYCWRFG